MSGTLQKYECAPRKVSNVPRFSLNKKVTKFNSLAASTCCLALQVVLLRFSHGQKYYPTGVRERESSPLEFSGRILSAVQSPHVNAVVSKPFSLPLLLPICILKDRALLAEVPFPKQ